MGDGNAAPKAYERDIHSIHAIDLGAITTVGSSLIGGGGKTDHVGGTIFAGLFQDMGQPDFFENFHIIPRQFDFGNVLSAQSAAMSVHSAYRKLQQIWSSFTNNAGAGTTLTGLPSFPATMEPLADHNLTLNISTTGNPTVDDDLAFEFNFGGVTISVPIVLNRIVLFPVRPEIPYRERLQFRTDIIPHDDGGGQYISVRKNPRQLFEWNVRIDDGTWDKGRMDTLLFDWQAQTWGVPMWHEATHVTVLASAGALTINVDSTADADYRVGGLVLFYTDSQTFDVQTITSFTSTTITIGNATLNEFAVGAAVAPLRAGHMGRQTSASRFVSGDQSLNVQFRIIDNDSNLADTSAFDTHNSKVLLDSCNIMRSGTLSESYNREIVVLDNGTGLVSQLSPWANGLRSYPLTLRAGSKAELWQYRQLMHALRGRQVSFYVPTFGKDLLPDSDLVSASQDLDIVHIGYTQFIRNRQPRNRIWIKFTDGTSLTREITGSVETTATRETLTLDATWGSNYTVAQIERISYLEEVRFDRDEIGISYNLGERQVHISAPVTSTFD